MQIIITCTGPKTILGRLFYPIQLVINKMKATNDVDLASPVLEILLLFKFSSNFPNHSPWGSKNRIDPINPC